MKADAPIDDLYREVVLDHHRSPRGRSSLSRVDADADGLNPSCGDEVRLAVTLDGDRIVAAQVIARGCAISTASGSMLAELIEGCTCAEALAVADRFKAALHGDGDEDQVPGDLDALLGVRKFPMRVKCALLPWMTLGNALTKKEAP